MWKLTAGILMIIIAVVSLFGGSYIWVGGLLVAPFFLVRGTKDITAKRRGIRIITFLDAHRDDLLDRVANGIPIDTIAEEYWESNAVPPIRTIQYTAYLVQQLVDSGDEEACAVAAMIASVQIIDGDNDPRTSITEFSFVDQVYYVDDTTTMFPTLDSTRGTEGTLILSKGFLFFLAKRQNVLRKMGIVLVRLVEKIPFVWIVTGGYATISGLHNEMRNYFTASRKRKLQRRYDHKHSWALPLVAINDVGVAVRNGWILSASRLQVSSSSNGGGRAWWFETTKFNEEKWVLSWQDRIQIACIAEGVLLKSPVASSGVSQ